MLHTLEDRVLELYGHYKMAPNGWMCRNAVCCDHRGERSDTRGRGGLIINQDHLQYHCFNCNFNASFFLDSKIISRNFALFLSWLGMEDDEISKWRFLSLRGGNSPKFEKVKEHKLEFIDLPTSRILTKDEKDERYSIFLKNRGLDIDSYTFLISSENRFRNRIIIPFILENTIIGYTARSIVPDKVRYIQHSNHDFVFGLDNLPESDSIVFLCEGIFDALSIGGLAVMHNAVNEGQLEMILKTGKKVIVIPDMDKAGLINNSTSLIGRAMANQWGVVYPNWKCKDVSEALSKYGRTFVIAYLLKNVIYDVLSIQIQQKLWYDKLA